MIARALGRKQAGVYIRLLDQSQEPP
jgi:hypothetical protein